jgi:hypothetical protein
MYYFTIGAIFKNESHILKEWVLHYLNHGVEHIILIDDNSEDNYIDEIKEFIDNNKVTLYINSLTDRKLGIQSIKYNYYFKKHIKETKWFGIVDLDEFMYSPKCINITDVLKKYEDVRQLQINWVHFGSSNHIKQPTNVVENFLYRGKYNDIKNGPNGRYNSHKSIVNCMISKNIVFDIHTHICDNSKLSLNVSFNKKQYDLLINHYAIQSLEYWKNIKMTRGDVNKYYDTQNWQRNFELFKEMDNNEIFDDRLKLQNQYLLK